jgi:hypothetical protein
LIAGGQISVHDSSMKAGRLNRVLYGAIVGFVAGEALAGIPLIWADLSDALWDIFVLSGTLMMSGSICVMAVVVLLSGRHRNS